MAEDFKPSVNGGSATVSYNGSGEGPDASMDDLMRKLGGPAKQQILLQGSDDVTTYPVYGVEVAIVASTASSSPEASAGSNKVKINPAVKHDWEQKYYLGNVVASHKNGVYIAYVLKVRLGGVVRIINRKTAQRALLKGFEGLVMDIAFAHLDSVFLACVDEIGTLHVYSVEEFAGETKTTPKVKIMRPAGCGPTSQHRVIWCPFIPDPESDAEDEEEAEDVGKLLVVTHDNQAEMFCLDTITARKPPNLTLVSSEITDGYQVLPGHEKLLTDAVFSPDGSALATACLDGEVRVFSVSVGDDSTPPKCLHKWTPHDGRPLSLLVFLDNYKEPQQQFWKFAITGANYNQELKLWSCVSWTCLQTIKLFPPPDLSSSPLEPCLKATVDATANYLILSDINRKVMYVFHVDQDWEGGRAHISSVSEFLLTSPCLSFTVLEAGRRKCKKTSDGDSLREYTTGENSDEETREEEETIVRTFIRMYAVHTKALQELQIQYEPDIVPVQPTSSISSISQDEAGFRDALTDISVDTTTSDVDVTSLAYVNSAAKDVISGAKDVSTPAKPLLLTPDVFAASPRKYGDLDSVASSISTNSSSFTQVTPVRGDRDDDTTISSFRSPGNSTLVQSSDFAATPGGPSTPQERQTPQLTPSNIPLPPVTPGEEELNTSLNNLSSHRNNKYFTDYVESNFATNEPSAFSSPRTAVNRSMDLRSSSSDCKLTDKSMDSAKSTDSVGGGKSSSNFGSEKSADFGQSESVKALFAAASGLVAQPSGSRSSSRSGSIEVDTILSRSHEESDMGVGTEADAEQQRQSPVNVATTLPEPAPSSSPRGPYDSTIWPKAPDLNTEAKRLVTEALHNSGADSRDLVRDERVRPESNNGQTEKEDDVKVEVVEISSGEENDVQLIDVVSAKERSQDSADGRGYSADGRGYSTQTPPSSSGSARHQHRVEASADQAMLSQLNDQLSRVTSLLTSQQQELVTLRQEVKSQHQLLHLHQQHHQHLQNVSNAAVRGGSPKDSAYLERIDAQISDLTISLSRQVDSSLNRFTDDQTKRLEDQSLERTNTERQRHDKLATTIASQVSTATAGRLDKAVRQEMKASVVPAVSKLLEPLKEQLHVDMAQKLTATDQLMRDAINRMVTNRQTVEAIGQSAGVAVQGQVQAAYRDTVQNLVMPSFDRSCQEMYRQINEAFMKGTKEYQSQVENQTERLRKKLQSSTTQLQQNVDSLPKAMQEVQTNLTQVMKQELDTQFKRMNQSLKDGLSEHVKQVVRQEIDLAMKAQQDTIQTSVMHAIRSSAGTPLPSPSPAPEQVQANITALVHQGNINAAFQQALSASDLSMVMYVCETVDPQQVFSQDPCPLQQPVLLSLIQQLSADLNINTELKHRFLQEAIMNLDVTNRITMEHMPTVLGSLCTKLIEFIQANPSNKMTKQMRMLLMASQSLHQMR